ncbi:MAG: 23S rRNA (uracil(1939)-C(5))-methyltransferase RlmD [bacterium]|nr:23S rRNA (uracil(1939)-C(5))-methyltransferase RlmD [bacterium]
MEKILTLKIENFSSSGEGMAKHNGFVIFVENALPDDLVKVEIIKENKHFAKAKILEIIKPSKGRVKPFCALYNACGACSLQSASYDFQLKLKKEIVQDAIRNIGGLNMDVQDVEPAPLTKEFRCKIQYPTAQTKVSKRILAGYYKPKSHEIVNIKHCPIQPAICDEIVEYIRQKGQELNISCYDEKKKTGLLRHIVIRHSSLNGSNLVTLVVNDDTTHPDIKTLAQNIFQKFEKITGVCVNFNITKSNLILGKETVCLFGEDTIEEKILDKTFKIGANTFFQVNPKSAENIFGYVKEIIKNNYKEPVVLDAYAGIAAFGIVVSDVAKEVLSVEENESSTKLAQEVIKNNNIQNVQIKCADTGNFLTECSEKFDIIILDPPRKGCDETTLREALRLSKGGIIYVSCNPATLARDLKYLVQNGARVKNIKPFDMFCHTPHVETVALIEVS